VSIAPALSIATGATLSTATGIESIKLDAVLASPPCARLGVASSKTAGIKVIATIARKARRRENLSVAALCVTVVMSASSVFDKN
jgi:hypothetical protein